MRLLHDHVTFTLLMVHAAWFTLHAPFSAWVLLELTNWQLLITERTHLFLHTQPPSRRATR